MCHPFVTDVEDLADEISSITGIKGQFIEIRNDETPSYNFHKQISLAALWIEMNNRKNIRNEVLEALLPFSTIYLYEAGF